MRGEENLDGDTQESGERSRQFSTADFSFRHDGSTIGHMKKTSVKELAIANSFSKQRNHSVTFWRVLRKTTAQSTPILVGAFVCLIALAALAAPQYPNKDRDRDRGSIRVSRERIAVDFGGGRGGASSPDAVCEEDSVAVGFHVQTGEYFNTAWLDCVHVRRDGDVGDEVRMTERTGSRGGRPVHDAFCPRGMVLRGLRGRTGASIDEAVGICSPFREIAERRERMRTETTQPVLRPNAGGHPAGAECPLGSVVTGFHSNSGEYMDHLWVLCSELRGRD
jgi:hypothetical protein